MASQCFSVTYHTQKRMPSAPAMISGTLSSRRIGSSVMNGIVGRVPKYAVSVATRRGIPRPATGASVPVRAKTPRRQKYAVRSLFTRSLGRNLKSKKKPNNTQLPMNGKRIASCLVIASVVPAATGRTDLCEPAYTARVAVARMLQFVSTGVRSGATARSTRRTCASGAATWRESSMVSCASASFFAADSVPPAISLGWSAGEK